MKSKLLKKLKALTAHSEIKSKIENDDLRALVDNRLVDCSWDNDEGASFYWENDKNETFTVYFFEDDQGKLFISVNAETHDGRGAELCQETFTEAQDAIRSLKGAQ